MELPEIPKNKDITYLGLSTFRDKNQLFGIKRKDRRQHVYVVGKSGTGKSVLLLNMITQNIQNGEGVCVVDPHGELVESVLSAIPEHRVKDVVYFNPADTEYNIGFNVLELVDPRYKNLVASGLMGIFTKIWSNVWSARMEYILNNCILALLDTPGTTLLGIPRLLVDKDYRNKIIANLKDPVIKAFWVHEYEAWEPKFRNEAIAPIQNKVGQFLSSSTVRNVVGQGKSTINVFDIMNEGKIFLVNVSKGRIGEDNSGLLGGMIITKIQLAAMERVRIPEERRKDFYLYVDEFQNFVTDAFASILSEARKYRLNLTVAHQYTAQLVADKSSAVRDAVFGNVGTMIVFRVGSDDAKFLEKEFEPEFTPQDILSLPNYKIYLKLMIDGVTSRPFSAKTLPPMVKSDNKKVEEEVIRSSRDLYCKKREDVEQEINEWSGMSLGGDGGSSAHFSGGGLEKFPIICSLCKLEKTVPFKPEPGRAAYCKECIAKIKSGEVKVAKKGKDQIEHDESKFFKPLSDLGIEFEQKKEQGIPQTSRAKTEVPRPSPARALPSSSITKPGILSNIKKVFISNRTKPVHGGAHHGAQVADRSALKELLNKTLTPTPVEETPISLDSLKQKTQEINKSTPAPANDRAASTEDMSKLKDLISEKISPPSNVEEKPAPTPAATPVPQKTVKEVPEDVLKKILE